MSTVIKMGIFYQRKIKQKGFINKILKQILYGILGWMSITIALPVSAHQIKDTTRVLFVGNSFTHSNNLPHIINIMSKGTQRYYQTRKSTAPGAMLSHHWNDQKGLTTKTLIETGEFDVVIFQEHSMGSISFPDSSRQYFRFLVDLCLKNGSTPYIFQTWAYKHEKDKHEIISEFYYNLSKELKVTLIPVGDVWYSFQNNSYPIDLYDEDGIHPGKYGTYLTALTIVYSLTNELSKELPNAYTTQDYRGESIQLMHINSDKINELSKAVVSYLTKQ